MDKVTDTREQRLAGIRERAETWLIGELHYIPGRELTEAAGICAAFADSENERVLLEATKATCIHCAAHSEKYITRAKKVKGKWLHEEIGFEREGGGFDCYAGQIHDLRSKGEGYDGTRIRR